ncbi:MAG: transglutaminase-like domain-containing protein [Candidatus Hydrothermarchaeales archaeon]
MLDAVLGFAGVQDSSSEVSKLKKILGWLNANVHYESDLNNIFRAPVETLSLKSGDCDDYSILTGALFERAGVESAVGFFKASGEAEGHAMVLVRLDDLGGYPNRYYSDLTHRGLSSGKWIKIEPQRTIDRQSGDYIKKWNLVSASEIK